MPFSAAYPQIDGFIGSDLTTLFSKSSGWVAGTPYSSDVAGPLIITGMQVSLIQTVAANGDFAVTLSLLDGANVHTIIDPTTVLTGGAAIGAPAAYMTQDFTPTTTSRLAAWFWDGMTAKSARLVIPKNVSLRTTVTKETNADNVVSFVLKGMTVPLGAH